jgi:ectoine hydroxylase-related dioxygenase (phytanoyl-CoA dioxygenase family)
MADILEIVVTKDEIDSASLSKASLAAAETALREDGCVVLQGVVDLDHVTMLRNKMLEDLEVIMSRKDIPTQFTKGNVQQDPPPMSPYLFKDVLNNHLLVQVTAAILGAGLKNSFYSGNTNLPGSEAQPVHPDSGQLWPNLTVAHPAYSLVVNLPVVDMDVHNGSTELWPGTHTDTSMYVQQGTIRVPSDVLEARRAVRPPLQPAVKAGDVLIRDMRLWHRGVPNFSDQPRPMIAMIHNSAWWPTGRLEFEKGSEYIFEGTALQTPADFVATPIDYLNRHGAYDVAKKS